jgi:regulator of RNase E activity RraA
MFDERGEGLILRGGRMVESEEDRRPHLTAEDAYELLRNSLKVFRQQHGHYPARVVLHKTSRFDRNELAGFHKAIDERDIVRVDVQRPSPDVIEALLGLADLCSTVSDALDEVGAGCAISGSTLAPRAPGRRIAGPAVTIRYVREGGTAGARIARAERPRLADRDVYAVGRAGDVAVFDCSGAGDASVMGGLSARWAERLGIAGCVVDGAVRDVESIGASGVPVWSRTVTPRSGKHRMRAVEINGRASIDGAAVEPGDVIVADGSGVCVVPAAALEEVVALCLEADATESKVIAAIASGATRSEVQSLHPPDRW